LHASLVFRFSSAHASSLACVTLCQHDTGDGEGFEAVYLGTRPKGHRGRPIMSAA